MINSLVYFVIYIIVIGMIVGLLLWLLDQVAGWMPEPFFRIARVAIIVIAVLIVIFMLLQFVGGGPGSLKLG